MLDTVFTAAGPAGGVAPVMFGNEFLVGALGSGLRLAARRHRQRFPASAPPPLIFRKETTVFMLKVMPHRQGRIGLTVKGAGHKGDGHPRDQLAHKNDAAPPLVCAFSPDIKAEVHFFEIAM